LAQAIISIKQGQPDAPAKQGPAFDDPGFAQSMLIGAGRTFDRIGKGAQQMYYGATGNDMALADLKASAESDDAAYKPLQQARPWATGIGESLPSMVIPAGGGATLGANAVRMALAGAIPGALEYGAAGERGGRALMGAAAGVLPAAAAAVGRTAKGFVEPFYQGGRDAIAGRLLNQVAGDSAPGIVSRLQQAGQLVPGSAPTVGQVAESGGLAALERTASQANPEAYTVRAMEQASARLGALRGIAQDGAALKAAEQARSAAAGPIYDQAKASVMNKTADLAAALDRLPPEVMAKAQRLAKLAQEPLQIGRDMPEQLLATGILDASGRAITNTVPAQTAQYSGKALHYIKLALDDTLSKVGDGSLGNVEKGLMTGAKDSLLSAIDKGIPAYGVARQTFADLSRPVNQMEIGQDLYKKVAPALSDYGALGQETAATFGRALREGDATAARATGFKGATLESTMDPGQMATLTAIAQDLARKSNAQNLGRGIGSDTFQKIAMSNIAEQTGMPRVMGGLLSLPGINRATRWIYQDADQQMRGLLSDALLNPQQTAKLMTDAERKLLANNPKSRKIIEQTLLRTGLLGAPSAYGFAE
jgi:hypothetical protein